MLDKELLDELICARAEGKKIGLVQGSWDLFHLGHLRYLLKARELCDFLIVAMDSDKKIKKRKGSSRPIIPENERYDFIKLLNIADGIVIKQLNEPKWGLIRAVKPDVLIAIKENYSDEEIIKLEGICGKVAILPRQSESSTSDKIRKITIAEQKSKIDDLDEKILIAINNMKERIGFRNDMPEPIPSMFEYLKDSTDWICPVVAACYYDGRWYFGANKSDFSIPKIDTENRSELYYATIEHAEINLLKKIGDIKKIDTTIWTTLFPCDRCMKVLIDKGVKKIYYLEDHPNRNWSKRSHELASKKGIEIINILDTLNNKEKNIEETNEIFNDYKYIYPPNAKKQEQLDIMMNMELSGRDPLAPDVINQEILFTTNYWYISRNKFPYEGIKHQFLIASLYPIYKIEDMSKEMWIELENIWLTLKNKFDLPGGALCFRFGDPLLSGASLTRIHAHLIMPKEEEKAKFTIGGRKSLKKELKLRNNN